MKHIDYKLYWNTNTVIPIETHFYKHNQEHFLFSFQMDDFSAIRWAVLVSQRLLLLKEEESSPCLPLGRAEWGFLMNLPSPSRQTLLVKIEYQSLVQKQRPHPADQFSNRSQHLQISRHLIPACVHAFLCTYNWKHFAPHFMCSSLVGVTGNRARWLFKNCCFWHNNKVLD